MTAIQYGNYLISDTGRVFSLHKYAGKQLRELTYEIAKDGYRRVALSINGVVERHTVHRLVAELFINNTEELPVVDHIDRDKLNNAVSNLRWASYSDNERNKGNKRINAYSLNGDYLYTFSCIQAAVDALFRLNITQNTGAKAHICSCCRGRVDNVYGMRWRYAE